MPKIPCVEQLLVSARREAGVLMISSFALGLPQLSRIGAPVTFASPFAKISMLSATSVILPP